MIELIKGKSYKVKYLIYTVSYSGCSYYAEERKKTMTYTGEDLHHYYFDKKRYNKGLILEIEEAK